MLELGFEMEGSIAPQTAGDYFILILTHLNLFLITFFSQGAT